MSESVERSENQKRAREFLLKWVAEHYVVKANKTEIQEMQIGDVENCIAALLTEASQPSANHQAMKTLELLSERAAPGRWGYGDLVKFISKSAWNGRFSVACVNEIRHQLHDHQIGAKKLNALLAGSGKGR